MKPKFTPGPWLINASLPQEWSVDCDDSAGSSCNSISSQSQDCPVAFVVHDDWRDDETFEANTQLISAAPDLYEALASIENDDGRIPPAIWELRNKALAKARGEL